MAEVLSVAQTPSQITVLTSRCPHHWQIAAPDSPLAFTQIEKYSQIPMRMLPGSCDRCGEIRNFPAADYSDQSHWRDGNI